MKPPVVEMAEKAAGAELDAPAPLAPGPDQRRQASDGAHRHPAAVVALQPIVDPNGRWLGQSIVARQIDDPLGWNSGDGRGALRRPVTHALDEPVEAKRVPGDVVGIAAIFIDQNMHHGERQRTVRARMQGDPLVAGLGRAGVGRVDRQHTCPLPARLLNKRPKMQVAGQRVAAPDQNQPGMGKLFGQHPLRSADGVQVPLKPRLRADRAGQLAGAQPMKKTGRHPFPLQKPKGAAVRKRQHRFRTLAVDRLLQTPGNCIQRTAPRNRLEPTAPFWPTPARRREQPTRMVGALQIPVDLATQAPACDRVERMPGQRDSLPAALLDRYLPAARVRAVVRTDPRHHCERRVVVVKLQVGHLHISLL